MLYYIKHKMYEPGKESGWLFATGYPEHVHEYFTHCEHAGLLLSH